MTGRRVSFLLTILFIATTLVSGFKEHEFKKCATAGFCRRNRGKSSTHFSIDAASVRLDAAVLSASLINEQYSKQLQLSLTAYDDGFVRLIIDEAESVGRYKITDITTPEVETRKTTWVQTSKDASQVTMEVGAAAVVLSYKPFKLQLSVQGKPAVTLNSRDMFNFEHRRPKDDSECDGCWEETFLQHTDSKPKGPEAISLDISFPGFDHVYGIPERATSMALKPTTDAEPYRLYNLDVFEYLHESPFGLYGSIPMMVAHKQGLTTGVFWLNAAEMFVDVAKASDGTHTQWIAESGIVDLYLFVGPAPADVIKQYSALTGTTAMPQMFSIGYHQCRWNYRDEPDVYQVDGGFDQHAIPYDVLWLDIEHTNGKRYLTWDSSVFPHPVEMQQSVASRGRKMVTIVDPHVKRDSGYYIFSEAEQSGYYVKNKDGNVFDGWCWPGSSSYLDVTSPAVRQWWAKQFALDKYQGSTQHLYIWNDMNEPSVFNGPEITMHKDNLHWGNVEHRDVHNLYGLYYHLGTAQGLEERGYSVNGPDGDRPFVLSRAFFSGTQRVGPIWTGDNAADWNHLQVSLPMLLTLGVTGLPFSGADVGGFFGNPDAELLTRWYQLGTFYPFFRGHAHLETQRREPWLFGEPTTTRIKDSIRARYALLPYMYTLFRHANVTGMPVLRPLWFEFPDNKDTFALQDQFMLGSAILVRPVITAGARAVDVLLPRTSRWYDMMTGVEMEKSTWLPGLDQMHRVQVDMESIPAFYRGGSVVARRERPRRSTATQAQDPVTLVVAVDHQQGASGDLYMDDGRSFAFKRGQYLHKSYSFKDMALSSSSHQEPGTPQGTMQSEVTIERVVFLGLPANNKGYKAKLPGGQVVELEAGPVSPRAFGSTHGWVLRKPDLAVAGNWVVEIVKA